MKTSCKNCTFAIWDDKTQIGCEFNRLDKFKELDLVEELQEESYRYYLINRVCNACTKGKHSVEEVREYIRPSVDYILVHSSSDAQLDKRIDEIRELNYKPEVLYIVIGPDQNAKEIYIKYCDVGTKLLVTSCLHELDDESMACIGMSKSKSRYCTTFSSNKEIPKNLIEVIDNIINDELEQFICIRSNDFHGATIAGNINKVYKNSVKITDRIAEIEKARPDLVRQWK